MATLKKLELMHREFGRCEGHTCRECCHFLSGKYHDRTLKKCEVYGDTRSEASDWAGRWLACGMFNKPYSGRPIIELVKRQRDPKPQEPAAPLEGQMKMEV